MTELITENIDIPVRSDNIILKGSIYFRLNTPSKAPFIINLPGFMHHRGNFLVKFFSERFADAGYYVLSYDYRGHGETQKQTGSRLDQMITQIFSDIHVVIDWIIQNQSNRLLENKIALFGRSLGGAIILSHGFIDERAKILIALSTRYDYRTIPERYQNIEEEIREDIMRKISPNNFLKKNSLNNDRILIAHCKDDNQIPFKNLYQIKENLGLNDYNVIEFDTGGHTFSGHREEIFKYALEFLKKL
ncbi:MAG: alpha/beta fold hydrolase [Promethearchaeota archaeon]|nr:MAG: alpha/beta fold hydrolase [Candidatus Lokiarchaeota archaeon]